MEGREAGKEGESIIYSLEKCFLLHTQRGNCPRWVQRDAGNGHGNLSSFTLLAKGSEMEFEGEAGFLSILPNMILFIKKKWILTHEDFLENGIYISL